jgi:alanine dehydrogenase
VKPGAHINAIGADAAGKQELASAVVKAARVIVDDMEQATHSGEVNVPIAQGIIDARHIHAELGQVVAGIRPGRLGLGETTMFDSTGLALQDLACAAHVYRQITGAGRTASHFDFLK